MATATKTNRRKSTSARTSDPLELRTPRKVAITPPKSAELQFVPIGRIQPAADNHRQTFDEDSLQELAESIRQHGVLQPLLLRPLGPERFAATGNSFEIVAGERRWRAAKIAGLTEVPAQVVERSGLFGSLAMLHENIMRVDLNPIERAEAIKRLMDEHGLTQAEVGAVVGVQQGQISNELRLLKLPASLQARVADGRLAPTLIRTILPVADIEVVADEIAQQIDNAEKNGLEVDARFLKQVMKDAVLKHTRCMKVFSFSEYAAPRPTDRHFSKVSDEQLEALDVREFKFLSEWDGQKRALNKKLFNELNQPTFQKRKEKHEAWKKQRSAASQPSKKNSKVMFESDWKVRQQIEIDCCELLADALETCKDKAASRTVSLALLAMAECVDVADVDLRYDRTDRAALLLERLSVPPAQQDQLIRNSLVNELRNGFNMPVAETIVLAKALGADLLQAWKPSSALLGTLTHEGRLALAEFGGVDADRICVVDPVQGTTEINWPAGLIPPFLQTLFGHEDE